MSDRSVMRSADYYEGRADATEAIAKHVLDADDRRALNEFVKLYRRLAKEAQIYHQRRQQDGAQAPA